MSAIVTALEPRRSAHKRAHGAPARPTARGVVRVLRPEILSEDAAAALTRSGVAAL